MRKWVTRMREKHVDDVSRTHTYIHTYRSTAIFSYTRLVWGSLRLAPIILCYTYQHNNMVERAHNNSNHTSSCTSGSTPFSRMSENCVMLASPSRHISNNLRSRPIYKRKGNSVVNINTYIPVETVTTDVPSRSHHKI